MSRQLNQQYNIYKQGFNEYLSRAPIPGIINISNLPLEALNNKTSRYLLEDSRTDTGTVTRDSSSYANVADTELTIKLSRQSRVILDASCFGGGDSASLTTLTVQIRLDSTGYGTPIVSASDNTYSNGGASRVVLNLDKGNYTFGLQYKGTTVRLQERTISYFIRNYNYTPNHD